MLPIPQQLLNCSVLRWVGGYVEGVGADVLNEVLRKVYEEQGGRLEGELAEALGLTREEYNALVEWGTWLNELGAPTEAPSEEELEEE